MRIGEGGTVGDASFVCRGHVVADRIQESPVWTIYRMLFDPELQEQAEAYLRAGGDIETAIKRFHGSFLSSSVIHGNLLLNEGINLVWTLVAGGSGTAFNNSNSYLGVGDSSTAESASQTGLQASTNKLYKAMDTGYPTYGTSQKITFRSTFGGSEANFAWNEFTAANGNSDSATNLNRKVSAQGTKTSGQTWQLTLEITLS